MKILRFVYRNYKDEIEERLVEPDIIPAYRMEYFPPEKNPAYHPNGGWMISGTDLKRNARRTFELKRIIGPIYEEESPGSN